MSDDFDWVRKLVDDHAWIFHIPTLTVGRVKKFYGPDGETYVSTINQEPVLEGEQPAPVLELEEGHTFVAHEASVFLRLSEGEVKFYESFRTALGNFLRDAAIYAGKENVAKHTMTTLIASALTEQAAMLRRPAA